MRERQSDPTQVALVPHELFDRGRRLALRLAEEPSPMVLLHGDFTPVNILDGGERRGLVAIDPCPTLGDPAFDAIDLLFWQAGDLDTIRSRVELLALIQLKSMRWPVAHTIEVTPAASRSNSRHSGYSSPNGVLPD